MKLRPPPSLRYLVVDTSISGADFKYWAWAFWPFAQPTLDLGIICVVVATMAVLRGVTRQSVSAFRLAAVASAIHVVLRFPTVVGTLEEMDAFALWPWQPASRCRAHFEQQPDFLGPSGAQARALCTATRCAVGGVAFTFVCMFLNVGACLRCFLANAERPSMLANPLAAQGGGADEFAGLGAHDDFAQAINTNATTDRDYEPKPGSPHEALI